MRVISTSSVAPGAGIRPSTHGQPEEARVGRIAQQRDPPRRSRRTDRGLSTRRVTAARRHASATATPGTRARSTSSCAAGDGARHHHLDVVALRREARVDHAHEALVVAVGGEQQRSTAREREQDEREAQGPPQRIPECERPAHAARAP